MIFKAIKLFFDRFIDYQKRRLMNTVFYKEKRAVCADFKGEATTTDGSILLLEAIERQTKYIQGFSRFVVDKRTPHLVQYSLNKWFKLRVFQLCLGYENGIDVQRQKGDPAIADVFDGEWPSPST